MYTNHAEPAAASVLCMPLLQGGGREREGGVREIDQERVRGGEDKRGNQGEQRDGGEVVGVLELARKAGRPQFGPEDEEIVQSYFAWAAVALHSTHYCKQQRILSESMITLTRYRTAFKLSYILLSV